MPNLEISPVRGPSDMRSFLDLPWKIYPNDANWVPPIKSDEAELLNPDKHPFWQSAQREIFLARQGQEVVGRIVALVDHKYNQFQDQKMGAWGFFECINDPEVAGALFQAAEHWVGQQGMEFMRGPLSPSTNYSVGMLVKGFDRPPVLMMPYNPSYYPDLAQACGLVKEKDLYAFIWTRAIIHQWPLGRAQRLAERYQITLRGLNKRDLGPDLRLMSQLYNKCWSSNWGFVPMSDQEWDHMGKQMGMLIIPELAFFLLAKGEPVGFCVILPDISPILKRLNGKMGPLAMVKWLLHRKEITGLRCLLLGLVPEYRSRVSLTVALDQIASYVLEKTSYQYMEMGWTLEDNREVNQLIQNGGMELYKCYRVFRRDL